MNHQEELTAFIASFVDELSRAEVNDVVISPGSRSTPIAYCMAEHPDMNVHINIDERSAAFFALGMAKEKRKPVALLCTSGTAAANYFPAIVEAYYSRVPLIVLTADRPHELRDVGAPQAIDQINLYGKHVKWFVEMSLPDSGEMMLQYARTVASRAISNSILEPAGPVHVNFPLREPLIPILSEMEKWIRRTDYSNACIDIAHGHRKLADSQLNAYIRLIEESEKGIIICGPIDQPDFKEAILNFAEATGYPILADPLSQLRAGGNQHVIETYDTFLKEEAIHGKIKPDLIIRFGAMPVSKPVLQFVKKFKQTNHIVVDGGSGWREPAGVSTHMVYCDEAAFCHTVRENLTVQANTERRDWLSLWQGMNEVAKKGLLTIQDETGMQEGKLFSLLESLLPEKANLVVGNSMPIRNVDSFFFQTTKQIRILANRGANGIDGLISTAAGISASSEVPSVLALGDLSLFHDMNGFLAAKMYQLKLLVLVVNNDGGGIFSYLPQSAEEKHFEELFGTPHGLQFNHTAALYGANYKKPETWEEVTDFIQDWVANPDFRIVEICTSRSYDVKRYREVVQYVSREIRMMNDGE